MPYSKDKLPKCPVCGTRLSKMTSIHCRKHAPRAVADSKPRKPKTKRYRGTCCDCGSYTCGSKAKRCARCNYALRKKHSDVSEYRAEWARAKKYGLEPGEFDAFWIVFRGKCGICGIEMKRPSKGRGQALDVVAVDHCHKTGKMRGLLCNGCNKGLGLFKDNPDFLRNAMIWVTRSQES